MAVVAVVVSSVVLPAGAQVPSSASADPSLIPGMPTLAVAQERERGRRARRATTAEREARQRSRTLFGGRGRSAALVAARSGFGSLVDRPAWEAPKLRSGETVVGYAGDHLTKIKLPGTSKHAVIQTKYPARVKDDDGVMRPFDLSLQERPDAFVTANAAIDVRLPKRLSDGITLGDTGVSVSVPTSGVTSTATEAAGKAFWSDVETDVDLLVAPIPEGFESTHILRSAQAPQRLALTLKRPAGSQLRYTPARTSQPLLGTMASADHRGIDVVNDGRVIATIAPPSSVDGDGEQVPTRLQLDGDRVTLLVEHRDGDFKYPIAADPVFYGYVIDDSNWQAGYDNFDGWSYAAAPANTFNAWARNNQFGNGVIIEANPNAPYCCSYYGHWFFFAPGTSYMYRADLTAMNHIASNSQYFVGIANNSGRQASWVTTAPQSNSFRTLCVSDCGTTGATPGNRFSMGIQMTGPTGPTGAKAYLGRAALYLSDNDTPTITSISHNGLDSTWRSSGTATTTVVANDPGLGVDYGEVSTDKGHFEPQAGNCGDRNRCPTNVLRVFHYNFAQMTEGIHTAKARVRDAVQHMSPASTPWTIKIDRTAPDVQLSGDLLTLGLDDSGRDLFNLHIDARDGSTAAAGDRRSGVAWSRVIVGGVEQQRIDTDTACVDSCGLVDHYQLDTDRFDEGPQQVRVEGR